jgi:hypothetical protein
VFGEVFALTRAARLRAPITGVWPPGDHQWGWGRGRDARGGGTLAGVPTLQERFWKVVDTKGDCWRWTSSLYRDGHGMCNVALRVVQRTASATSSFTGAIPGGSKVLHGAITGGAEVLHACGNPVCVRPRDLGWRARPVVCRIRGTVCGLSGTRPTPTIRMARGYSVLTTSPCAESNAAVDQQRRYGTLLINSGSAPTNRRDRRSHH